MTEWLSDRHVLAVSAVAWCEFLCGPMDPIAATAILDGGVLATSDPGHVQRFLDAGLTLAEH